MKFTPVLTVALLTGAVKAVWTEKCSTTKGCDVVADKSIYTTPTLFFNSSGFKDDVTTKDTTVIYGNNHVKNHVVPFPQGFNMTSDHVKFTCLTANGKHVPFSIEDIDLCDKGLLAEVQFPSCYNGQALATTDNSHVAFRVNGACPPAHSLELVDLSIEVTYPIINRGEGNYFFNGGAFTASFEENWLFPVVQAAAVDECASKNELVADCLPLVKSNIDGFSNDPKATKSELKYRFAADVTTFVTSITSSGVDAEATVSSKLARAAPVIKDLFDSYVYNGCWSEGIGGNALTGFAWTPKHGLTVEKCVNSCKGAGFGVAGLEFGQVCYCGAELTNGATLVDDLQCGLPCSGDATEECGGEGRLTTYKSG